MEQFVIGKLKLVAVLRFGLLVVMLNILPGILHLISPIIAAIVDHDLLLLNAEVGDDEIQMRIKQLLSVEEPASQEEDAGDKKPAVRWVKHDKLDGITLIHHKAASSVEWHSKGDYFTTVVPTGRYCCISSRKNTPTILSVNCQASLLQQYSIQVKSCSLWPLRNLFKFMISKRQSRSRSWNQVSARFPLSPSILVRREEPFLGLWGDGVIMVPIPGSKAFCQSHASNVLFKHIRWQAFRDNVIVGSKDGKLCWLDTDLSTKPYKTLKNHSKDITSVTFHRRYPLFASSSEDCTAYVFHGMVYSDLNQNPLIVPLEIIRGHQSSDRRGVLHCKFHPRQPWLFTAGADSVIRLYCE